VPKSVKNVHLAVQSGAAESGKEGNKLFCDLNREYL